MTDFRPVDVLPTYLRAVERNDGNAGLWYDKFGDAWGIPKGKSRAEFRATRQAPSEPPGWIDKISGAPAGEPGLIVDYTERQRILVQARRGRLLHLESTSRFVTGLGREHPIENGFTWHHTLGAPFLPASGLKGLLRAWMLWQDEEQEANQLLGEPGRAGAIVLLDLLPTRPLKVEGEVMTPHYNDYYQGSEGARPAPGDWLSPNPISFLAVASGAHFQCGFFSRDGSKDALERVEALMIGALGNLGAGAKTAVGYGRFERVDDPGPDQRWEEDRVSKLAPPERWRYFVARAPETKAMKWVREKLDNPAIAAEERDALRKALIERFHERWAAGVPLDPSTSISSSKLKEDYAARLIPLADTPSEPAIAGIPPQESKAIAELGDDKNAMMNLGERIIDGEPWSEEGLRKLWLALNPVMKRGKKNHKRWLDRFRTHLESVGVLSST